MPRSIPLPWNVHHALRHPDPSGPVGTNALRSIDLHDPGPGDPIPPCRTTKSRAGEMDDRDFCGGRYPLVYPPGSRLVPSTRGETFVADSTGGGVMSAGSANSHDIGTYIILAGLAVQLLFFGVFVFVAFVFHFRFSSSQGAGTSGNVPWVKSWNGLLWVLYLVSALILIRSAFRMVEFAQGFDGYLIRHEIFMYVFDTALMFVSMVVMNTVHPSGVSSAGKGELVECETLRARGSDAERGV